MDTARLRPARLLPLYLLGLLWPGGAAANGAFPAVSQLVTDPSNRAHLVLRSNFGLLTSRDGGQDWDLVCEGGIGYRNIEPPIAVLGDGSTIAALETGIARSGSDQCNFAPSTGIATYVADVARIPGAPNAAVAVSVDMSRNESQVWRSLDSGQSWQTLGAPLLDLNAVTLDVASDEADTVYVSGSAESRGVTGVLARTSDAGLHWDRYDVPGANKTSAPYIAAVPDAQTAYVRLSGTGGRLLVTHDGGLHLRTVLEFRGPFDGFALSPDGTVALASGRADGIWRAPTPTLVFERLSCARLRCLSWSGSGLFACADEFEAGFVVGESVDQGNSFEPRLHSSCVRGPLACPSLSTVGSVCPAAWPAIAEQLGTDCGAAGSFRPSTTCPGEVNASASADAGAGGAAGAGSSWEAAAGSGNAPADSSCSFAHRQAFSVPSLGFASLLALSVVRRRNGQLRRRERARRRC